MTQNKRKKIKEYIKNELKTLKDNKIIEFRMKQLFDIKKQEKQDGKESDKTKVSIGNCSQRIQKYAFENKIEGNDKESASLVLMMDLVDVDGTVIGVLKEGVFFNKTYADLRKCLLKKFNVREVISVPQDQFENTSTKTSIIIFDNTKKKISKVKFYDLVVEKYTQDKFEEIDREILIEPEDGSKKGSKKETRMIKEIILTESKNDICGISDKLVVEVDVETILENPLYSLNSKDYNKREIIVGRDMNWLDWGMCVEALMDMHSKHQNTETLEYR